MEIEISNPVRWYFSQHEDADWWHRGGKTREEAIAKGRAGHPGEPFWIASARNMVPSFAIFDADDICEKLGEDECWWEDGWTGVPDDAAMRDLEGRLEATFKAWFAEKATLDGACLDEISSEKIEPEHPRSQPQEGNRG